MEEDNGIEPLPFRIPLGSSQLCALRGIFHLIWRTPKESNLQPSVLETDALPIELEILYLVDALGIEPRRPIDKGFTGPTRSIRVYASLFCIEGIEPSASCSQSKRST